MTDPSDDVLAVIPARKGSKGLPGKNIRTLHGRPLVSWSIDQALAATELAVVHVSTDCEMTAVIGRDAGADVPNLRPAHLATDEASIFSVLEYVLDRYRVHEREFGYVMLIEPTAPLRAPDDLDRAVQILKASAVDFDSLVTVGPMSNHPALTKYLEDEHIFPVMPDVDPSSRRQDLRDAYFPFGVARVAKVSAYLAERTFYTRRCRGLVIDRWQSYEIDDEYDFACVEAIMRYRKGGR